MAKGKAETLFNSNPIREIPVQPLTLVVPIVGKEVFKRVRWNFERRFVPTIAGTNRIIAEAGKQAIIKAREYGSWEVAGMALAAGAFSQSLIETRALLGGTRIRARG
jgi:hypothetical protein